MTLPAPYRAARRRSLRNVHGLNTKTHYNKILTVARELIANAHLRQAISERVQTAYQIRERRKSAWTSSALFSGSGPVSRVLSSPAGSGAEMAISLGCPLPGTSSGLTREHEKRATSSLPYLTLLRMGFARPASRPAAGALLPHHFTLTGALLNGAGSSTPRREFRRCVFCCTFLGVTPTRR